ncbi:hypothetical protein K6U17_14330 [Vibrio fluvialis]|uniref:hypothetical protein n=1 Tax=Vibrio fluvialis TaxID=676 RepID=UPI001EEB7AA3|nr:hypothetical protein [Vibrio fluvialis]MCG6410395.1 hypothetical protein [Vibrio fluvialis]
MAIFKRIRIVQGDSLLIPLPAGHKFHSGNVTNGNHSPISRFAQHESGFLLESRQTIALRGTYRYKLFTFDENSIRGVFQYGILEVL